MKIRCLLISIFALLTSALMAVDTSTTIFKPEFRTLKVEKAGHFMSPPVITLGSNERISISFDELAEDYSSLRYRIVHCNADWQPSSLSDSEYIEGFNASDVEDYAFSSNTYIHYVNYHITIPSEDTPLLRSGNYLLQVYDYYDPEDIVLQCRFQVDERTASITSDASGRTDKGINTEWQQLSLRINVPQTLTSNPYNDILLYVSQNNRPETTRIIRQPSRIEGNEMVYEHIPELIFPAGNEYRRFETVRNDYPGMHVDSIGYTEPSYHAWLTTDYSRAGRNYVYDRTQHGRFKIDEYNSTDPDLGADYVTVHFTLDFPQIMDGDIFVQGELAGYDYTDFNRMKYNPSSGLYELAIPLKQGSYNYQYVARKNDGSQYTDSSLTEGDYAETSNEYNISVYLRTPGSRGDRLVGSATISN